MEHIKELLDAFLSRIKNPLWSSAVIALFILNWKVFVFLFFSDTTLMTRFTFFDQNTTWRSLLAYPLVSAIAFVLLSPRISYIYGLWVEAPIRKHKLLLDESSHQILEAKNRLSAERNATKSIFEENLIKQAQYDAQRKQIEEENLIKQAIHDTQIKQIDDEEIRDHLKSNIEANRADQQKKDSNTSQNISQRFIMDNGVKLDELPINILLMIDQSHDGRLKVVSSSDGNTSYESGKHVLWHNSDRRHMVQYSNAVKQLLDYQLIIGTDNKGEFLISANGYNLAEQLKLAGHKFE